VVRREMQRLKDSGAAAADYDALDRDFPYMALDTCAVDGLCATACPVSSTPASWSNVSRQLRHTALANSIAVAIART
jgi:D-lactate dehydrogenase